MTRNLITPVVLCALGLGVAGCNQPARVLTDDRSKIVSLDRIDVQDWNRAAEDTTRKLANSGVLERAPEKPAVVKISRIVNNTAERVDVDLLTQKVKIALNQSGKAICLSEDDLTRQLTDQVRREQGLRPLVPYYTLSGKIIQLNTRAGSVRQVSYVFQLNLATVQDGLDIWAGETEITKQGTENAVGF